jgi:hypothetical protein
MVVENLPPDPHAGVVAAAHVGERPEDLGSSLEHEPDSAQNVPLVQGDPVEDAHSIEQSYPGGHDPFTAGLVPGKGRSVEHDRMMARLAQQSGEGRPRDTPADDDDVGFGRSHATGAAEWGSHRPVHGRNLPTSRQYRA